MVNVSAGAKLQYDLMKLPIIALDARVVGPAGLHKSLIAHSKTQFRPTTRNRKCVVGQNDVIIFYRHTKCSVFTL